MALVTKAHGDSQAVLNTGTVTLNSNAVIINTGIAPPITAYKIGTFGSTANLAVELGRSAAGTDGAVEVLLRTVAANATVIAYQVDAAGSSAQLSVIVERSGWTSDTALRDCIRALVGAESGTSNIGSQAAIDVSAATVSSTGGIKLA